VYLSKLTVFNFKNYGQVELDLSAKINCFTGLNGTGKTNLLDAVYYLSLTKSYFNAPDSQAIRHDEKFFSLFGVYSLDGVVEEVSCGLKRGQKKVHKRNGKEYVKLSDHIGLLPIVMISPSDYELIVGGSEERRKFMDSVISQSDRAYLAALMRYNRALMQRNSLLKQDKPNEDVLQIWDSQLWELNELVFEKRKLFVADLIPIFQDYYSRISMGREQIGIRYKSQLFEGDVRGLYRGALQKDLALQYSSVGIHRDDLILELDGYPLRKIGSQGQQKTMLAALKFAQFDFMKLQRGVPPILLLDDIFDKLDGERVAQIVRLVSDDHFGQIFISDTNTERMLLMLADTGRAFRVFGIEDNVPVLLDERV
jgi:DNA replication and repair protein RecF